MKVSVMVLAEALGDHQSLNAAAPFLSSPCHPTLHLLFPATSRPRHGPVNHHSKSASSSPFSHPPPLSLALLPSTRQSTSYTSRNLDSPPTSSPLPLALQSMVAASQALDRSDTPRRPNASMPSRIPRALPLSRWARRRSSRAGERRGG